MQDDAAYLCRLAEEINSGSPDSAKVEKVDEKLMHSLAYNARGDLCPMQAVIGSIAAQEVMKVILRCVFTWVKIFILVMFYQACSGKFNPIKQFLYFDSLECLPEDGSNLDEATCKSVSQALSLPLLQYYA